MMIMIKTNNDKTLKLYVFRVLKTYFLSLLENFLLSNYFVIFVCVCVLFCNIIKYCRIINIIIILFLFFAETLKIEVMRRQWSFAHISSENLNLVSEMGLDNTVYNMISQEKKYFLSQKSGRSWKLSCQW